MIDESGNGAGFGVVGMTALEEIKKALEGVTHAPGKWEAEGTAVYCDDTTGQRVCDTKGEYLFWSEDQKRNAAVYIAAANPVSISELLSTLESLQRENEALKNLIDGDNCADPDKIDALFRRAEAAESEVKRLEDVTEPFRAVSKDWVDENGWTDVACQNDRIVEWFGPSDFRALASTGGEHNAE